MIQGILRVKLAVIVAGTLLFIIPSTRNYLLILTVIFAALAAAAYAVGKSSSIIAQMFGFVAIVMIVIIAVMIFAVPKMELAIPLILNNLVSPLGNVAELAVLAFFMYLLIAMVYSGVHYLAPRPAVNNMGNGQNRIAY